MTKEDTMTDITPPKPCTKTEAKALTERIRKGVDELWALLLEAHERKAWKALGYDTWAGYVKAEFDMSRQNSYLLLDQGRAVRAIEEATGVKHAGQITQRDAQLLKDVLPTITDEIKARVGAGEKPEKAAADVIAEQRAAKAAAKAERDAQQAEWDRQREESRRKMAEANPAVAAIEAAKARNGSHHAAVAGKPADEPYAAVLAERDELREENEALRNDVAELTRKIATYDDRVVLWEKGGLDAIEANYREQIRALEARVEEATADRAKAIRQRDYWKKQAMSLGYVSPNAETANADEWSPF